MDMLAKVAAVGAVTSGVVVAGALSYGLIKSVAEPRVRMGKTVAAFEAAAEIKVPTASLFAPMAEPPPTKTAAAPEPKRDLGSAMSAALLAPRKKPAAMPMPPTPPPVVAPDPGGLELGFKTPARDSNLGERAVKSTSVQQTGGAERQRLATSEDARVHFDVDLAAPR